MADPSIKDCLKGAREAIDKKAYKEALDWSEKALKADKDNYNAFIFKGLATANLDKPQDSEAAYRKAIAITPGNALAWRGLSDLFTKTADWAKLVDVLKELIKLSSAEPAKVKDYATKLIPALEKSGQWKEAIDRVRDTIPPKSSPTYQQEATEALCKIYTIQQEGEAKDASAEINATLKGLGIAPPPTASSSFKSAAIVIGPVESAADIAKRKQVIADIENKWAANTVLEKMFEEIRGISTSPIPLAIYENQLRRTLKRRALRKELQTKKFFDDIIRECQEVLLHYPNSYFALETKLLMQEEDFGDFAATQDPRTYLPYAHMHPTRGLGWVGVGLSLVVAGPKGEEMKNFVEKNALNSGGASSQSLTGWLSVARWYTLGDYFHLATEAIAKAEAVLARRVEECGKFDKFWVELKLLVARIHFKSRRKDQAITIYKSILEKIPGNVPALRGIAEQAFESEEYDAARGHLDQILAQVPGDDWAVAHVGWLSYLAGDLQTAKARLSEAIAKNPAVAKYHYWMGKILWDTKSESPLQELLVAAKLDPNYAPTFTLLGHYYRITERHDERSKRCYQKALSLDILDNEAGQALSDVYIATKQNALAVTLYRDVTTQSLAGGKAKARSRWAWIRLALHQLDSGDWSEAENSFQQALRINPKDGYIWQGLGETYRRSGKFLAAKKALLRAVECIPPPAPYVHMQLASLDRELGVRDEAIQNYKFALQSLPDLFPALLGLAETLLAYARELHSKGYFTRAHDALCEGVEVVKKCSKIEANLVSVWKLMGDLYTFHYHVPSTDFKAKIALLAEGNVAYEKASTIQANDAYLLYDRGVNYYYQMLTYRIMLANNHQTQDEIDKLTKLSVESFQRAIERSPHNSQFWNGLGTALVFSNPLTSQHCLIFALNRNNGNADAWTNLGILYMRCGQMVLANQAFSMAQAGDAMNVVSFLGRGLIYEMNGTMEGVQQAFSTYMHIVTALQQDPHPEGHLAIGYTAYLLKEYDIANTYLQKYLQLDPNRIEAHLLLGLVLEAQGLLPMAYKELSRAQELTQSIYNQEPPEDLRANPPTTFVPSVYFSQVEQQGFPEVVLDADYRMECLLVNRARILARLGKYEDALDQMGEFEECEDPYVWRLAGVCEYFLDDASEESPRLFQRALQLAGDDSRMEVLVALCQIYFKQDNVQKAKQAIAQCVKQFGTYTRGLFAMATLGLLVREAVVTNAAIEQAVRAVGPIPEVYYVQAVQNLLQGNAALAQVQLTKAVHQHPHLRDTWIKLGQLLSSHSHSQAVANQAELCAEAAAVLVPFPVPRLSEADKASSWLLARTKLAYGKLTEAVNLLQRQVRMYPSHTMHWFFLAVALYFKALHDKTDPTDQIVSILTHMIKGNAAHTVAFLGRLALSDTYLLSHQRATEKTDEPITKASALAKEALDIATSESEKALATRQLARCKLEAGKTAEAVELYKASLKLDSTVPHAWQELGAIYDNNNQFAAAELTFKTGNAKTPHHHLASTLHLAHHYYTYTLNYRAGLDLLKDIHKKFGTSNPSPLPSLFQGAFLTLLADPKQQNTAVQALARAHDYANTRDDAALTAYFTDILNADKSAMAESKKAEAKVNAKQKFLAETGL